MPTKLAVKIKNGRTVIERRDEPDLEEAKRLWREGKSAQYILEQARKRKKEQER